MSLILTIDNSQLSTLNFQLSTFNFKFFAAFFCQLTSFTTAIVFTLFATLMLVGEDVVDPEGND
jgi:hypothetical protein